MTIIDTFYIKNRQVNQILQFHEGHFGDLKRKEIKPSKITQSLSAFANADGGDLYIGIGEHETNEGVKERFWDGFKDIEEANGHIQTIQEFFPFEQYFNISFLQNEEQCGYVLLIQIHKTKNILNASDSHPYVRRGAQNIPIKKHEDLKKLEFDKGITSYEQQVLNIPIEFVTESDTINSFVSQVIPTSEPESWLKKQLLIQSNKPTVASVLLFADEPQAALPKQCGIKIFRYKTRETEGTRETLAFNPITIEGDIYSQINEAVDFTVKTVESIKVLGPKGFEKITYPTEAIYEIVTNAVLHRDYSKQFDIKIIIFDNRIEVESPGKLPGHITVKNILEEQLARNGAIVRLINKFPNPPNKDVGEGLNTAFNAMRDLRLKEPVIKEENNSVRVIIYHEPLASPEEIVMNYLSENLEISNSIARELCGIHSENEMKRIFQKLNSSGLLERTPGKGGGASTWRKISQENNSPGDQIRLFE